LFYSRRTVCVSSDFSAEPVSFGDDCANLFVAELGCFGRIALGQNPATRADLYAVRAVFGDLSRFGHQRRHAIGNAIALMVKLGSEETFVSVSPRYSDCRPRCVYARTGDIAGIDGVAQRYVGISVCANVAHRGEAGFQSDPRILRTVESFSRCR